MTYYQVQTWEGRHGDNTPCVIDRCPHLHRTEHGAEACFTRLLKQSLKWHTRRAQVVPVDRRSRFAPPRARPCEHGTFTPNEPCDQCEMRLREALAP